VIFLVCPHPHPRDLLLLTSGRFGFVEFIHFPGPLFTVYIQLLFFGFEDELFACRKWDARCARSRQPSNCAIRKNVRLEQPYAGITCGMPDKHTLTLRQSDQARGDLCAIESDMQVV
jgi:hypothetical protein